MKLLHRTTDEDVQRAILRYLYDYWQNNPVFTIYLKKMLEDESNKITKEELYRNAMYLSEKGYITKPSGTILFRTQITAFGIDLVEDKRVSPDPKIRRNILELLKEAFSEDVNTYVTNSKIIEATGFSKLEIFRNIKYLEAKRMVKVLEAMGGHFRAKITARGIDSLKESDIFEKQTRFMSNAYYLLYKIENELRIFIEKKLVETYGDKWWEMGVPLRSKNLSEQRKAKEPDSSQSLLYYTEFDDLRKIIMKNWNIIFKNHFGTLEQIISRLDELEPIRHTIAHTRLLSNDDFDKLELFYREIRKMTTEE